VLLDTQGNLDLQGEDSLDNNNHKHLEQLPDLVRLKASLNQEVDFNNKHLSDKLKPLEALEQLEEHLAKQQEASLAKHKVSVLNRANPLEQVSVNPLQA